MFRFADTRTGATPDSVVLTGNDVEDSHAIVAYHTSVLLQVSDRPWGALV